ncbi:ATP-binding protein [Phytohabitans suffuscus]|uniref:ATP-binding protein n=1 Tax=Phytohabitans suffuscus TaxID=624315 RepID=UPI001562FF21|nr:BREX system ATP-binding domain-containing protein [Phytohabitans suffuscus]
MAAGPPGVGAPVPLVGRATQLEALDAAVATVAGGRLAAVVLHGEPGIGKTSMLRELERRAAAAGLLVCAGQATEFEQDVPFATYAEALRPLLHDGATEEAAALRRALDGHGLSAGQGSSVDRARIFSRVRGLLDAARTPGVALLLDDLHWADEPSLELTEYLIRKPPRRPALVAVAFRTGQPLSGVVKAIAHAGPDATHISLPHLGPDDVDALLPELPRHRRALILRASGGNPLYLQVLSRLRGDTLAALVDNQDLDTSESHVLTGLVTDIADLDERVRRVACAAAVAGDHAPLDLVAYVAELPVDEVVDGADELHRRGLMDVDAAQLRFRHPLVRAAAHELAGPAWRVTAHARAAVHLRANRGPLRVVAHHAERSAQPGDEASAEILIEAGLAFTYGAPAQAARWLGAALRLLPDGHPSAAGARPCCCSTPAPWASAATWSAARRCCASWSGPASRCAPRRRRSARSSPGCSATSTTRPPCSPPSCTATCRRTPRGSCTWSWPRSARSARTATPPRATPSGRSPCSTRTGRRSPPRRGRCAPSAPSTAETSPPPGATPPRRPSWWTPPPTRPCARTSS